MFCLTISGIDNVKYKGGDLFPFATNNLDSSTWGIIC